MNHKVEPSPEFRFFLQCFHHKLEAGHVFIESAVSDYKIQDWESLFNRLIHEYPVQAKEILLEALVKQPELATSPLVEVNWQRYLQICPVEENQAILDLPLPISKEVQDMIRKELQFTSMQICPVNNNRRIINLR